MAGLRAIAAAQTIPRRGDVDANVESHVELAQVAAEEGARVLVFPELSLTGYELDLADELAFTEHDARLDPLVGVASSCALTLIVGAPVRLGSRFHIGAFIVSPGGPPGLYTKHHLGAFSTDVSPDGVVPPAEASIFHPGNWNPLVAIDDQNAAVAVCADTSRASHPENAARRGARSYLASMFFTPGESDREAARLGEYAAQHAMAVAAANYGGPSGGLPSAGGSAVWSDQGELLARLESAGQGVAVAIEGETGWRARAVMR